MTENQLQKKLRLKAFRDFLNLSQLEMANLLGISRPNLSKIENPEDTRNVPKDTFYILNEKYNLSKLWWETGEGSMVENSILKDEVTPVPYEDYMMVEYVDLSVSAGYMGGSDVTLLPEKKIRLVPKEFENGNYLVVRVDGDSMDNGTNYSIPNGTEVLVKELEQTLDEKLSIRNNLFVVCSREGNVLKQIVEHNLEHKYIKCHSYNDSYADYVIPFEDVIQIFIYRKIVSMRPPIPDINSK